MDLLTLRDRLNQLPFRDGLRRVLIGRIMTESGRLQLLEDDGPPDPARVLARDAAAEFVRQWTKDLQAQGLQLTRGPVDADDVDQEGLFVVQTLRREGRQDYAWFREALDWATRITTVGLEMILPGLGGLWLDRTAGTGFLGALGFVLGFALGVWHLLKMSRSK